MRRTLAILIATAAMVPLAAHAESFEGCMAIAADASAATTWPEPTEACSGMLDPEAGVLRLTWSPGATALALITVGEAAAPRLAIECSVIAGLTWYCRTQGETTSTDYLTANFAPLSTGIRVAFPAAGRAEPIRFTLGHAGFSAGASATMVAGIFWLNTA